MFLKYKKPLLLISIILLLIIIIGIIIFIFKLNSSSFNEKSVNELTKYIQSQNYEEIIPKDRLEKSIALYNDTSLSKEERYAGLYQIGYYLQDAYYSTNDPKIRKRLDDLNKHAKNSFPGLYDESNFQVFCTDPECGSELNNDEKNLINNVENLEVDKFYTKIILKNLRNGFYTPYDTPDNKADKISLLNLAYNQLLELNNSDASNSASLLKEYSSNKYKVDISDLKAFVNTL